MASVASLITLLLFVVAVSVNGVAGSKSFKISNNCSYTVWPGILSGAGSTAALDSTGFELAPGESRTMQVPTGWSGRIWGRTLCSSSTSTDSSSGRFTCVTGDCGSGKLDCAGGGPAPPATLAQFTLDGSNGMDFYDVSLVDGFNLPMLVAPQAGAAARGNWNCAPAGCAVDLNGACPAELRVTSVTGDTVACKSACLAFGSPDYCCTGEYGAADTCKPSAYSELFKHTCPRSFSYAYDSAASTFTCGGADTAYTVTFCPNTTSGARSSSPNSQPPPPGAGDLPHIDVTVVGNTTGGGGNEFPAWGVVAGTLSVLAVVLGAIFGCFRHIMKRRAQGAASAAGEK